MKKQWCITGSSQPYTVTAENFETAVAVCLMLGEGLGLRPLTDTNSGTFPQLRIKESIDVWLEGKFNMNHHQFMKKVTSPERINDLARAVESVELGLPGENGGRPNPPRSDDLKFRANHLHKKIMQTFVKSMARKTRH